MTVTFSAPVETPRKKSRSALLPLLILLFLVSYSILAMLVIEQGRTIESQRILLREMLKDSNQLAELKTKLATDEAKPKQAPAQAQAQAEQKDPVAGKTPAANEKDAKRSGKTARSMKSMAWCSISRKPRRRS